MALGSKPSAPYDTVSRWRCPQVDEMHPTPPSATGVPAADVTVPPADGGSVVHQAYPLKQPVEELDEFLVRVRGSTLRRARRKLTALVKLSFPWAEVLLGVSTLCAGGGLGALASGVAWNTDKAVFYYVILPVIAVGTGVGYALLRHLTPNNASLVAQDILEELPDPDRTK